MKFATSRLLRRRLTKGGSLFSALLVACASITVANAQTTYTDGSTDGTWDNSANWSAGVPTPTSIALFDGLGAGTVTNGSADTAFTIQIGQPSETSGTPIGAYTLTGGTINMPDASGSTIIDDEGTANTATQTINSNLVLGTSSDTGVKVWTINDLSGGNLNIGGNITFASATPTTETTDLNINVSTGNTVTLSGSNAFNDAAGTATALSLGTLANAAYGNLRITNAAALGSSGNNREEVFGTSGALQFDTGTGTGTSAAQTTFLSLAGSRTSESAPELENVSGTNTVGEVLIRSTGNHYVQSDAGLLTISSIQEDGGPNGVVYLDGSGNGVITGSINNKTQTPTSFSLSVVKDGSGTWTYGTLSSIVGGTTVDPINTSVAGGTLLVDTISTTAMASNITVTNSGTGNAVLGGKGHIAGAVILSGGGTINPGDVGVGSANIGTLTLTSTAAGPTLQVLGGGTLQFDLDSDLGTADELSLNGTGIGNPGSLSLGTGVTTLSLDDVGSTALAQGTVFTLVAYTGTLTGAFMNDADDTDVTVGLNTYLLDYGTGSNSDITLTVVPEPQTWLLLLLGLSSLVVLQRRRSSFQS